MKKIIYASIILLAILHHDWWWWDNSETLVFGFIPIGLAYHAGISVTAGILWALVVKYCWPGELDDVQQTSADSPQGGGNA